MSLVILLAAAALSSCGAVTASARTRAHTSRTAPSGGPTTPPSTSSTTSSSSSTTSSTTSTTTTTTPGPTTTVVSAPGGHVTVLEVGDSLGIDLGWGLDWALASNPSVQVVADAKGDSGLVNTAFYNWPAVLQSELETVHPQIVIVFLGANDHQSFYANGVYDGFGSPSWVSQYTSRVDAMMNEATAAGAEVLWVGMPIMQSPSLNDAVKEVDAIYERQAATHPHVTYLSSWNLFTTPSGQFNAGTALVDGSPMTLRTPDGVHLASGGADLLALAVVKEMRQLYGLP